MKAGKELRRVTETMKAQGMVLITIVTTKGVHMIARVGNFRMEGCL